MTTASDALHKAALSIPDDEPLRVLELGAGCGIVSIMLALQRPQWRIDALEIQPGLHALARENAVRCEVEVNFILGDLREFNSGQVYGLILSNPPWLKTGSGLASPHPERNIGRFETHCGLGDVLACLARNLAPDGDALLLYPQARRKDILLQAPKTLLDIISLSGAAGLKEHMICHIRHKGHT